MTALAIRLPDHKHERLKAMAAQQGTSLARLLDELTKTTQNKNELYLVSLHRTNHRNMDFDRQKWTIIRDY